MATLQSASAIPSRHAGIVCIVAAEHKVLNSYVLVGLFAVYVEHGIYFVNSVFERNFQIIIVGHTADICNVALFRIFYAEYGHIAVSEQFFKLLGMVFEAAQAVIVAGLASGYNHIYFVAEICGTLKIIKINGFYV